MKQSDQVSALLSKVYDAAASPYAWNTFLDAFATASDASVAALFWHDEEHRQYDIMALHGASDEYVPLYTRHYAQVDEWITRGTGILRTGWVGTSQMLCPDEELVKTEFHSDFLRRFGLFHQFGGILTQHGRARSAITLLRPKRHGSFGKRDVRLLDILMPHLQRAMTIRQRFVDLEAQNHSLECALDLFTSAIIFVNVKMEVLRVNRSAETLLNRKNGLLVRGKNLTAYAPHESAQLQRAVVAAETNGSCLGVGGTVLISRREARPLSINIAPMAVSSPYVSIRAAAILFVTDPEEDLHVSTEILQQSFGLTPAEARIANLLVQGKSLTRICDDLCISYSTVRAHLRSIFDKLGVRRQGELVSVLLRNIRPIA
jgi:DNA-binding CsgD family transcriptional regulator